MREAHKVLLDSLKSEGKVIFFQAPTGYGKTSFTPTLYREIKRIGGPPALIHVLPLKAIVEQAYNDFNRILKDVNVGVQAHGILEGKSPYLSPSLTVTTFDSFTLNIIGANVAEKGIGHYLVPKAMIASSAIILDEVHLPLYSGDDYYATGIFAGVYTLALWKNPVVVETATLPSHVLTRIVKQLTYLRTEIEVIEPIPKGSENKCRSNYNGKIKVNCVPDPKYYEGAETVKWYYTRLKKDTVQKVLQLAQTGQSIFRAVDNVEKAIGEYERLVSILGEDNVALLHSRLTPKDRKEQLEKVMKGAKVLVGTSAVEAGVNISYDVLVTDVPRGGGAPLSLLQRMGRINRDNSSPEANIYLVGINSPQGNDLIDYLIKVNPNPRVPYDTTSTKGYRELLDIYSKSDNVKPDFWYTITSLTLRSLKPYEVMKGLESAYNEACGLIREVLLTPIMPNPCDIWLGIEELLQDPYEYIFPIDHRLLPRVIWQVNGRIKALVMEIEKSRDHPLRISLTIKEIDQPRPSCKEMMAHMLKHGVVAYIASPGLYRPGKGLLVRKAKVGYSNAG